MDPIIEEEEEDEGRSNRKENNHTFLEQTPMKTPKKRNTNFNGEPDYTFTPSKLIPRNKYTDQPPLWPPAPPSRCVYVESPPKIDETHQTGHRKRPSLVKAQSTPTFDAHSDLSGAENKKESSITLTRSLLSLRPKPTDLAASNEPVTSTGSAKPKLETLPARRPSLNKHLRAKTLPIENQNYKRGSLVALGLKLPANWGKPTAPEALPKPYDSRICDGCHKIITLAKKQYVCNDKECGKRLCDRCYRIWLDSKYRGRLIDTTTLQTAHSAEDLRQRHWGNILGSNQVPFRDKVKYLGEATSYECGGPIIFRRRRIDVGTFSSPSMRNRYVDLDPLREFCGKDEVAMTLRSAARTVDSKITANMSPTRFKNRSWMYAGSGSTKEIWGWDHAIARREAAGTGKPGPAYPRVELQPPTTTAYQTSPARTINILSVNLDLPRSDSSTADSNSISTLTL